MRALTILVTAVTAGIAGTATAQNAPPGLVAAYSFDEGSGLSVSDGSGGNHTGIISGATWTTAGKYGGALSFNGTNSWVTVADAAALDLTTGMTLQAWVFPTAAGTATYWSNVIIKERTNGEIFNLYADTESGAPSAYIVKSASPNAPVGVHGNARVPLNAWTHLAATYDSSTLSLYVNGSLVQSVPTSGALLTSTGALRIGGNSVWAEFFQGVIDEVRVYNRALTQQEIAADMVTPLGTAPPPPPPPGADQVGQWSAVSAWPIVAIHASLLPTGEILAWDGFEHAPGSARLWNYQTGQFTSVPNGPNLFCAGHILMSDGRVLVLGGHLDAYVGITAATIYNPFARSWSAAPPMAFPRWYPTVTALADGRALVMSGNTDCATCVAEIPEIFNPATNSWSQLPGAQLGIPPYPYNFLLPNGKLLVTGGYHDSMPTGALDIDSQTWQVVDPTQLDAGSAVMYAPGKIMKSGSSWETESETEITLAAATTYVIDANLGSPAWRATAPMAFARIFHNLTVLPDGNVLVTGGAQTTDLFDLGAASLAAELWSPSTETWTTMASAQVPRFYHSVALLLPDGRVWVAGGGRSGVDQLSAEIYSPPYLYKGSRPVISAAPAAIQYGMDFAVQTPDAASITNASLIPLGSVTHTFNMTQRYVPLSFSVLPGGLNLQAPASGNIAPPGYYMLFVLNAAGVPSVAALVRLSDSAQDVPDIAPPTAPTSLTATAVGTSQINLGWIPSKDDVQLAGYRVERCRGSTCTAFVQIAATTEASFSSTGLAAGTTYRFRVRAADAAGNLSGYSNIASAATRAPDTTRPTAPTGLAAMVVSGSQINLTWTASTDNVGVSGYRVLRCRGKSCTNFALVATLSETSFADVGLAAGTTYRYRVRAVDAAGNVSTNSNTVSATTPAGGAALEGMDSWITVAEADAIERMAKETLE